MEEKILNYLNELVEASTLKDVYIIEYRGERLTMSSNKSSWKTIGAAKNALRYDIPNFYYDTPVEECRKRLSIIKDLEERGIIKYVKL